MSYLLHYLDLSQFTMLPQSNLKEDADVTFTFAAYLQALLEHYSMSCYSLVTKRKYTYIHSWPLWIVPVIVATQWNSSLYTTAM